MSFDLGAYVRDVPDFPQPGIVYKDITPLLADAVALEYAVRALASPFTEAGITKVVGIESRGFIFGTPAARELAAGFVPVRKEGRLPRATHGVSYDLEYGSSTLELHDDAVAPGERVLVVDDVLATGGTAAATCALVRQSGGVVVAVSVVIELSSLGGRGALGDTPLLTVLAY